MGDKESSGGGCRDVWGNFHLAKLMRARSDDHETRMTWAIHEAVMVVVVMFNWQVTRSMVGDFQWYGYARKQAKKLTRDVDDVKCTSTGEKSIAACMSCCARFSARLGGLR